MIKLGDCITVKPATFDVPGKTASRKQSPGPSSTFIPPGDIVSSSLT